MRRFLTSAAASLVLATLAIGELVFQPQIARDIAFEDTPVGDVSELRYTAIAIGQGPWTVRLNTNEQQFTAVPEQFVVQNGQAAQFVLRFAPQQAGVVNGVLSGTYSSNMAMFRISANLSGRGVEGGGGSPEIAVDEEEILFGIYVDELGTIWPSTEWPVVISNSGDSDLEIESITDPVGWLVCDHNDFVVEPNQEVEVLFTVPDNEWPEMAPDLYETTVTITSNDPDQGELELPVTFDRGFIPHYLIVLGDQEPAENHVIFVEDATLDDEQLDQWDEVAVFTPRGDLAGSGALEIDWPIVFFTWGEDEEAEFAGFRQAERFDFRIWDASSGEEHSAGADFIEGPDRFENEGISVVTLADVPDLATQTTPLRRGWDFVSLRVVPEEQYFDGQEGPEVDRLFADVEDNLQMVKDMFGHFYLPSRGFNNISYLSLGQGLQVRMADPDTLRVRGVPIPADRDINLLRGWNLVAYYPTIPLSMEDALEDLTRRDLLTIAKDAVGRFYLPNLGFGGFNLVAPGSALMLNVRQDAPFHYPARQLAGGNSPAGADDDSVYHFDRPKLTDGNMSVLIMSLDGIVANRDAEIACFTPRGTVAGAIRLNEDPPWGMAVWSDDSFTGGDTIEGFRANEPLLFRYWDPSHNWELEVSFDVIQGGEAIYTTNEFKILGVHVGVEKRGAPIPSELKLSRPYPNPFNATARFSFELPVSGHVRLGLYDLAGREQLLIVDGPFEAGVREVMVDATALPAGVYLAVLEAGGKRLVERAVLLK